MTARNRTDDVSAYTGPLRTPEARHGARGAIEALTVWQDTHPDGPPYPPIADQFPWTRHHRPQETTPS